MSFAVGNTVFGSGIEAEDRDVELEADSCKTADAEWIASLTSTRMVRSTSDCAEEDTFEAGDRKVAEIAVV